MCLGTLTTTYVAAPSCLASLTQSYATSGTLFSVVGPVSTNNCFPDNYVPMRDRYYSSGICPQGYTSACTSLNRIGSLTETAVTCCPTSFECNPNVFRGWESTMGCYTKITANTTLTLTLLGDGGGILTSNTAAVATRGGFNAFSYQVRFQSTDFPAASTSLKSPGQTQTPPAEGNGTSLSRSALVGIYVGSALGIVLVVGAAAVLFVRNRRARWRREGAEVKLAAGALDGQDYAKAEMAAAPAVPRYELGRTQSVDPAPQELEDGSEPQAAPSH